MAKKRSPADVGNVHGMAVPALAWIISRSDKELAAALKTFETTQDKEPLANGQRGEYEALSAFLSGETLEDVEFLGLAWAMRDMMSNETVEEIYRTELE